MEGRSQRGRTIAELVAAIGVILSLMLVAFEIRQNTSSIRAQTRQQLSDASAQFNLTLATTELGPLWSRFARGDSLTDDQMAHLVPALVTAVRNMENVYLQTRDGVIDESALLSYGWRGSMIYQSEAFTEWLASNRDRFDADFIRAFVADQGRGH